jgi:hypothetical protein
MDEASKQLIGEVNAPLPLRAGWVKCEDYEYERKGVCNQCMCCEPLRGWRHVRVTARRTKRDWAACIRELVDVYYPEATRIRLVLDNLNTHTGASLYEAFRRLRRRNYFRPLASEPDVKVSPHPAQASRRPCEGPVSSNATCWLYDTGRKSMPISAPWGIHGQLARSLSE